MAVVNAAAFFIGTTPEPLKIRYAGQRARQAGAKPSDYSPHRRGARQETSLRTTDAHFLTDFIMHAYKKPFRLATVALFATAALFASLPAKAFADDEARRAILELRQQIRQMNEQNTQARLQLADQIDTLRSEVVSLRGQVEKLSWQASGQGQGNAAAPGQQSPHAADPQEQAVFDSAMDAYRAGQYKPAADAFAGFLAAYPSSVLADEVRFYEGSSLYAIKSFKTSIQKLQAFVKASPQSPRAADALMVTASSQIELNDLSGAKTTLQRIVKDYPQAEAAETARSRLKLLE